MQRETGGATHSTGSQRTLQGMPRGTQGSEPCVPLSRALLISNSPDLMVVNQDSVLSSPSALSKRFLGEDDAHAPVNSSMASTASMDEEEEERLREQEQFAMTMLLLRNRVDLHSLSSRLPAKE